MGSLRTSEIESKLNLFNEVYGKDEIKDTVRINHTFVIFQLNLNTLSNLAIILKVYENILIANAYVLISSE
jgi:hypothetical protein